MKSFADGRVLFPFQKRTAVKFEYPWKGDFCGEWVIRIVGAQTGVLGCRVRGGTTVNLVGTCSGVRGGLKSTLEKRKVGAMG